MECHQRRTHTPTGERSCVRTLGCQLPAQLAAVRVFDPDARMHSSTTAFCRLTSRYHTQVDDQTTNPTWTCGYATSTSSAAYTTFTGNSSLYLSYSNASNYFKSGSTNRFAWRGQLCTTSYNYICRIPIGSLACPPSPPCEACELELLRQRMLCAARGAWMLYPARVSCPRGAQEGR
jgi:hypothetical protein